MNEKQLAQIEEWLNGDRRYKLLDCEQTGILQLKGALLQVWLASYMCENDDQESWLGIKGLMKLTGLSNRAVIDARRDLVAMSALADSRRNQPLQNDGRHVRHDEHSVQLLQRSPDQSDGQRL